MSELNRGGAAASLAMQLDDFLRGATAAGAFAVTGQWGAGKTTLLRDALDHVDPRPGEPLSIVEFTPWMYANESAIFDGFALLLLQETLHRGKARKRVAAGLRVLSAPLKALPVDASATTEMIASAVDQTLTPERIRRTLAKELKRQGRRVLLVIDDLDRLDPAELLTMFKLLRLVSDIPGLGYVLAFDEDTLLHLLQQTPIAHGSPDRARRYLEKLIERRTEVRPLTVAQMLSLLEPTLEAMPSRVNDGDGLGSFRLDVLFESRLTTPRAIERYTQALRDVPDSLTGEVDHWDLCSTVFLRMFFPEVWAVIVRERRTMTADHRGFADLLGDGAKTRAQRVQRRLGQLYEAEPDGTDLKQLIDHLFPALPSLGEGHTPSRGGRRGQRIGDPDYVDRYFWLDLPPGSIPDGEVRKRLNEMQDDGDGSDVVNMLEGKPSTGMTVLERALRAGATDRSRVFGVLDEAFSRSRLSDNPSTRDLQSAAVGLARTLLLECEPNEFDRLVLAHGRIADWPLVRFIFATDRQAADLPPSMPMAQALTDARTALIDELTSDLRQDPSPAVDQTIVRDRWFDLRRLGGPAESVVEERFTSMSWRSTDIASLALSIAGDSNGWFVALDLDRLRRLVGPDLVDRLRESTLPDYPDELERPGEWRLQEASVSPELANHIAAYVLKTGRSFGEDPFADRTV